MSYKFDSLIQILNILDRKEKVTVQSLMDDLKIAERSVYRYITTLRNADIPITYDREEGTYAFDQGYSLSRPDLSTEEILAFSLAKKLLGNLGPGMGNTLDEMQHKLSIKKTEPFKHIVIAPEQLPAKVGLYLVSLHQAARNFQRVELVYKALSSDKVTKRQVDPYYLFFQEDFWYVRGYCRLRKEFRTFALDRIASMKLLDHYFVPQQMTADEEMAGTFGSYVDGDPVEIILRFDEEIKPYVLRRKWHNTQRERVLDDGRLELVFTVNGLEGIKQWVYKWLPYVEVVSPHELRDILSDDLTNALAKHGSQAQKKGKKKP